MKKNRSIVKLVLSLLSLMVGIVWTGALIIVTFSGGAPVWRLLILLLFSALFLFLGIRGLLDWKKTSLAEGTKIPNTIEASCIASPCHTKSWCQLCWSGVSRGPLPSSAPNALHSLVATLPYRVQKALPST